MQDDADTTLPTCRWRGIHHNALVTRNLDATIDFYHRLLGMELGSVMPASGPHGRHCLLDAGGAFLHFFEQGEAEIFPLPRGLRGGMQFVPGAFQHVAFRVAGTADMRALQARLHASGVDYISIDSPGRDPATDILFTDNNGILLEAQLASADA